MDNNLSKIIGANNYIELPIGKFKRVVLLNNAATTPPFEVTLKTANKFLQTYGALHRGAGPHANITFKKVEEALIIIRKFINANDNKALLFTQNTSAAINLFVRLLDLNENDVVITSAIEHTSNNLPWQYNTKAKIIYANAFDDGSLDYEDLENKVKKFGPNLKVVAITGASNLTGYIPDLQRISKIAHQVNALLFVDAAQLAPHRPIDMQETGLDALAFSAHKIYAPFGLGILALPKSILKKAPVDPGGGSIDMLNQNNQVIWASAEARHQTGTWNVLGIIATAASCKTIGNIGWDKILRHERNLVNYCARQLSEVPGIRMYVTPEKYINENRIGTFTFNLKDYHHALLSSILENEYGIETRAGTICNHRLVRRWFDLSELQQQEVEAKIANGDRLASYGIVRASLGIHNSKEDIDVLTEALKAIANNGSKLKYSPLPSEETFVCIN